MGDLAATFIVAFCAVAIAVVLVCLYRFLARRGRAAGFVGMVIVATLGTEYCLRPFQILASGEFGWEPSVVRPLADVKPDALVGAGILSLAGVASFAFFLIHPWISVHSSPREVGPQAAPTPSGGSRLSLPVGVAAGIGVAISAFVALQLGRIGGSFEGEFGRQNLGSGYAYLFVNLAGTISLVALASLPVRSLHRRRIRLLLVSSYLIFVSIHLLVLGGRAEIIIVSIAILVVTTARLQRPSKPILVTILLLSTVALSLYRVTTRETFDAPSNSSETSLAITALQDPLGLLTRYDVSAFDKLVLLEQDRPTLRFGSTYAAALLAAIPAASATSLQGGNREFTQQFIPERYARDVTFEGVSMFGEAHFNLGRWGVPVAGGLAGYAFGVLIRRASDRRWMLVLAMAAGLFPSLIRADALNTASLGGSLIIFTLLISAILTRRQFAGRSRPRRTEPGRQRPKAGVAP